MPTGPRRFPGQLSSSRRPGRAVGLRATNFKAIASVEIPDVRLTVITGANSSGKSSLLQAILFLAQSVGQTSPVINGDLVRLGEPKDVIRDGTVAVSLAVGFDETEPDGATARVATQVSLRAQQQLLKATEFVLMVDGEVELRATEPEHAIAIKKRLLATEVPLRIQDAAALDLPEEAYLTMVAVQPGRLIYRASEERYRKAFERLMGEGSSSPFLIDDLLRSWGRRPEGAILERVARRVTEVRHGRIAPEDWHVDEDEKEALFEVYFQAEAPDGWASEAISLGTPGVSRRGFRAGVLRAHAGDSALSVGRLIAAASLLQDFAEAVVYLGPLRDDPRVAYPLGHTITNLPVGEKGEFTAAYLQQHGARPVTYYGPDTRVARAPLLTAVSRWCRHLGIADTVDVESRGKLGHELKLEVYGHERDPTAIGVGASQLLPVVVLVLGAPAGAIVLLEQPELHLHPKVQSRLGDFFALARPDLTLLVETHSEYLVTRLRLRVAEDSLPTDDVAILFAHQEVIEHIIEEDGVETTEQEVFSDFRRLRLDNRGDFDAWPVEFFDTLEGDSVAIALAVSKRLEDDRREPQ